MLSPQQGMHYTYEDYYTWDDGKRWELIGGVPYAMPSETLTRHQRISGEVGRQLFNFLKGRPCCEVFAAPFDVRLNAGDADDTVVQPDLVVVCDRAKIDDRGCKGAPDLVMEILSPSTARHDRIVKLKLYQQAGVREYWIVDPETKTVQVFLLKDGQYVVAGYTDEDAAPVGVLPGCAIALPEVFAEME